MFDFVGAFKRGIKAAKELNKHQLEVDEVFSELSSKFLHATDGEFAIERIGSFASGMSAALDVLSGAPPSSQIKTNGAIIIQSTSDTNKKAKIANWIKHPKGFTFVLQFEQREIISKSKAELGAALEELLSAPVVGKAYLSLLNSSQADRKERKVVTDRPLRVVKGIAVAEAKPGAVVATTNSGAAWAAAKPAAKPAAAKAAAKPAAKPAAAKAAAKPAEKPVAAKAAAKPAAKPAAAKAAAKPAAKPVAAKAAAKPAAKPAAAKAVKPAAKPAAAKPVAAKPAKPATGKQPMAAVKPAAPITGPAVPTVPNSEAFGGGSDEVKPGVAQTVSGPGLLN
ncbi:hypothetical protein [Pseudomonas chlororaphis]